MPNHYHQPHKISAYDAKFEALKLSFAPVVFQSIYCLLKFDILKTISEYGEQGVTLDELERKCSISRYGIGILVDMGLSCRALWLRDDSYYVIDKIGMMLLSDEMVQVNFDFIQDVCYEGLFHLKASIENGKPEGLKVFGDWATIYPALSSLPPQAKSSWFRFDHYYSDKAFDQLLKVVFKQPVKKLLDIGGNTGKWTLQCLHYNTEVEVTIADLPPQLEMAKANISEHGLLSRFNAYPCDMLKADTQLPNGNDVIWTSQFLDCFSETEIKQIFEKIVAVMSPDTTYYILELFWDRQAFEPASYSINCTSMYFTAMANGNSRMYHSKTLLKLLHEVGLYVDIDIDDIGSGHTLLGCKLKP